MICVIYFADGLSVREQAHLLSFGRFLEFCKTQVLYAGKLCFVPPGVELIILEEVRRYAQLAVVATVYSAHTEGNPLFARIPIYLSHPLPRVPSCAIGFTQNQPQRLDLAIVSDLVCFDWNMACAVKGSKEVLERSLICHCLQSPVPALAGQEKDLYFLSGVEAGKDLDLLLRHSRLFVPSKKTLFVAHRAALAGASVCIVDSWEAKYLEFLQPELGVFTVDGLGTQKFSRDKVLRLFEEMDFLRSQLLVFFQKHSEELLRSASDSQAEKQLPMSVPMSTEEAEIEALQRQLVLMNGKNHLRFFFLLTQVPILQFIILRLLRGAYWILRSRNISR